MSLKHWLSRGLFAVLVSGFALVMQAAPTGAALPPPAPGQVVTYNGGDVLLNVEVQALYYGQTWKTDAARNAQTGQFEAFLTFLVNSSYMDMLTNAGYTDGAGNPIGRGTFTPGKIDLTPINKGATLTDAQIQAALQARITDGTLAGPDANRLYVFFVQPDVLVQFGNLDSRKDFEGYHSGFMGRTRQGQPAPVWYAVIPYPGGVVGNAKEPPLTDFQSMTQVVSHELAEAVTDAFSPRGVGAWFETATGREIGDIAKDNGNYIVFLNGFAVQKEVDKFGRSISPVGALAGPVVKKNAGHKNPLSKKLAAKKPVVNKK